MTKSEEIVKTKQKMEDLNVNDHSESLETQNSNIEPHEQTNVEKMSQDSESGFTSCDVTFWNVNRSNVTCSYVLHSEEQVDGESKSIKVVREIDQFSAFYNHLKEYYISLPVLLPVRPCFLPLFAILSIRSEFENTLSLYSNPPTWYLNECEILEKTLCQRNAMIFSRFIQKIIRNQDFNQSIIVKEFLSNRELINSPDVLESIKTRIEKVLSVKLFNCPKNESMEFFVTRSQTFHLAIQRIKLVRDSLHTVTFNRINHLLKTMNVYLYMDTKDYCRMNPQCSTLIQNATLDLVLHLRDMENHFFYLHYIPISQIVGTLFSEVFLLENRFKMNHKLSKRDLSSSDLAAIECLIFGTSHVKNRDAKAIYGEYSDSCQAQILSAYRDSIKYLTECIEHRVKSLKIHMEKFDMKASKVLSLFHKESILHSVDQNQESSLNCGLSI